MSAAVSTRFTQWRIFALCLIFASCASYLLYKVYVHQVVLHDWYVAQAEDEHALKKEIVARRGDILDRNENPIAVSVMYQSLYAYPRRISEPEKTAEQLAPLIGEPKEAILAKLKSSKSYVPLKQKLPFDVSAKISRLQIPGTLLLQEPFRGYPEGTIAAQLMGFVGRDFQGLAGLELSLDRDLSGEAGLLDAERDTNGSEIAIGKKEIVPPKNGSDAILTIDRYIQRLAEHELEIGVKENKATGGFIIVMDPKTGAILAAATNPSYDLTVENIADVTKSELLKPTIATDMYEPGSVMKLVTMASALEEKLVTPDTTFLDTGAANIDGSVIRNWDFGSHGVESMTQVLINSCNIGAQWVAAKLGPERFYRYIDAFGFGKPTGIELPGEVGGMVRKPDDPLWGKVVLATNAYGQGIAVTAIQMITAVATIANDGILPKPTLIKAFRDGDTIREMPPVQVRRVISSETARTLTDMMVHVVEDNSLRLAVVPGYKIAGKTGTADLPTQTGYNTSVTYGSQVGFAPVGDPKFIILVRLDGTEKMYGGQVASPVFKRMAEQLLAYMKIPPVGPQKPRATNTPVPTVSTPGTVTATPARPAQSPANTAPTPERPKATQTPSPATQVPAQAARTATATPAPAAPSPAAGRTATPTQSVQTGVLVPRQPTATPPKPSATPGR